MQAPSHWWHARPGIKALLWSPLALAYGALTGWRMGRPGARADVPVICVGNFVVGGAGKTPVSLALFHLLKGEGFSPVFLIRGYGGRQRGPLLVRPDHSARDIGDEAILLAETGPTIVARDRAAGAVLAGQQGDLIIMDDGFQNPGLTKDISIVVVDRAVGLGNGMVMPSGPLRAPMRVQARKADMIIVLRSGDKGLPHASLQRVRQLRARSFGAKISITKRLAKRAKYYAFAGIGRPEKFFDSLASAGYEVVERWGFDDHYVFSQSDASALLEIADKKNLRLVTTTKDYARMRQATGGALAELFEKTTAVPVAVVLEDEAGFVAALLERLR